MDKNTIYQVLKDYLTIKVREVNTFDKAGKISGVKVVIAILFDDEEITSTEHNILE